MKTPKQAAWEANKLFRFCVVSGKLNEERVREVVRRVLESRRRGYLAILRQLQRLLKIEYAQHTAKVECAVLLPSDLQATVKTGLESIYGQGIRTFFITNPRLIGGMRIQVGSDVYDGSVLSGLVALQKGFGIVSTNGASR
ncbi:MAG: F0F1 ATP synthase subunit delta [Candidatus Sulfotelmatobacter sp.]